MAQVQSYALGILNRLFRVRLKYLIIPNRGRCAIFPVKVVTVAGRLTESCLGTQGLTRRLMPVPCGMHCGASRHLKRPSKRGNFARRRACPAIVALQQVMHIAVKNAAKSQGTACIHRDFRRSVLSRNHNRHHDTAFGDARDNYEFEGSCAVG